MTIELRNSAVIRSYRVLTLLKLHPACFLPFVSTKGVRKGGRVWGYNLPWALYFTKTLLPERLFTSPSSESQWGLTVTESPRPYFHGSTIRSGSDGKKLSNPSTSRTPAARHGAPSTNFKKTTSTRIVRSVLAYHPFSSRSSWTRWQNLPQFLDSAKG